MTAWPPAEATGIGGRRVNVKRCHSGSSSSRTLWGDGGSPRVERFEAEALRAGGEGRAPRSRSREKEGRPPRILGRARAGLRGVQLQQRSGPARASTDGAKAVKQAGSSARLCSQCTSPGGRARERPSIVRLTAEAPARSSSFPSSSAPGSCSLLENPVKT
ncbi:hypothetical protein MTO96_031795 [Rhipicephalus appendiculatus]